MIINKMYENRAFSYLPKNTRKTKQEVFPQKTENTRKEKMRLKCID